MELKDLEGNVIKTFDSQADCAKYLGVTPSVVGRRIQANKSFSFDNKLHYLNKVLN